MAEWKRFAAKHSNKTSQFLKQFHETEPTVHGGAPLRAYGRDRGADPIATAAESNGWHRTQRRNIWALVVPRWSSEATIDTPTVRRRKTKEGKNRKTKNVQTKQPYTKHRASCQARKAARPKTLLVCLFVCLFVLLHVEPVCWFVC